MRAFIMKYLLWVLILGTGGSSFSQTQDQLMNMALVGPSGAVYLPKSVVRIFPKDLLERPWSVTVRVSEYENPKQYYYRADSCPEKLTYVIIEGDRGEDLGWVEGGCQQVAEAFSPAIIRLATTHDVQRDRQNQMPVPSILEVLASWKRSRPIRMSTASRSALDQMNFLDGRIQLDARKISLYYSAARWVPFTSLVEDLYRELLSRGIQLRIWMHAISGH